MFSVVILPPQLPQPREKGWRIPSQNAPLLDYTVEIFKLYLFCISALVGFELGQYGIGIRTTIT